jgi:hypothetical protein
MIQLLGTNSSICNRLALGKSFWKAMEYRSLGNLHDNDYIGSRNVFLRAIVMSLARIVTCSISRNT